MKLFAVFGAENKENKLAENIKKNFDDNYYKVGDNQWAIAANLTTSEVIEKLDIENGESGTYIVAAMSTFQGYHVKDLWEWLQLKEKEDD